MYHFVNYIKWQNGKSKNNYNFYKLIRKCFIEHVKRHRPDDV